MRAILKYLLRQFSEIYIFSKNIYFEWLKINIYQNYVTKYFHDLYVFYNNEEILKNRFKYSYIINKYFKWTIIIYQRCLFF